LDLLIAPPSQEREPPANPARFKLASQCNATTWPARYRWSEPAFLIGTAEDLRGSDILTSQLADFEYLSG
jgi:hypothetical protein